MVDFEKILPHVNSTDEILKYKKTKGFKSGQGTDLLMCYFSQAKFPIAWDGAWEIIRQPDYNPNHRNKYGSTAIMYAAEYRCQSGYQIISSLIEKGADVNAIDDSGDSCLFQFLQNNHKIEKTIVYQILEAGYNLQQLP